jgi:hypothetical protein
MTVKTRLQRLEHSAGIGLPSLPPEDECPKLYIGKLVVNDDQLPPEEEIPRGATCGGVHVLRERLVVLNSPCLTGRGSNERQDSSGSPGTSPG